MCLLISKQQRIYLNENEFNYFFTNFGSSFSLKWCCILSGCFWCVFHRTCCSSFDWNRKISKIIVCTYYCVYQQLEFSTMTFAGFKKQLNKANQVNWIIIADFDVVIYYKPSFMLGWWQFIPFVLQIMCRTDLDYNLFYFGVFKRNANAFSLNTIVDIRLGCRHRHKMIFLISRKLLKLAASTFNRA